MIPPNMANKEITPLNAAVRDIANGRGLNTGEVTLTASATTTTVDFLTVAPGDHIALSPRTANAAAALATTYVSATAKGQFVLTHASNAQTDRTFSFEVRGS